MYSLFYILITIIIIINSSSTGNSISSISISSVALLNCLYLNPQDLPFVLSLSHPSGEEGEGETSGCLELS